MSRPLRAALIGVCVFGWAGVVEGAERPRVPALRVTTPLRVDGALDEPDWQRAAPIGDFLLIDVREGEAPSEPTDVRILYDDVHVYFGIFCANRSAGAVRASLTPRDQIADGDHIAIHLDTYRDLRRAYIFGVNPYGVQLDGILDDETPDFNWDGVWRAEARRGPDGWTAEIAVPFRTLRFPRGDPSTWGLWVRRAITKSDEVCSWPLFRESVQGAVMLQAGDLEDLRGLRPGGRLEVQPYLTSTAFSRREANALGDALGPWDGRTETTGGLDVKYGLTTTLAADATINPDFSQIEADALQIDVNRRFPLFFAEKRPFFLEGAENFGGMPFRLIYTRRMADPAFGAKLAGKVGGWRVNGIALRDEGGGSDAGVGAGESGERFREGWFAVGRGRLDVGEKSHVGFMYTDHWSDRHLEGAEPAVIGRFPNGARNTVLSTDARALIGKHWFFDSQLAVSRTRTDTTSGMLGGGQVVGRASVTDFAYGLGTWYEDGKLFALAFHDNLGRDFRAESGFLERVDSRIGVFESNYTFRPQNAWLRAIEPSVESKVIHDFDGVLQERAAAAGVEWSFQKQTVVALQHAHFIERWLARDYYRRGYVVEVSNSLLRPLTIGAEVVVQDGIFYADSDSASFLGWEENLELSVTARPSPQVTAELTATRSRFTRPDGGAEIYDLWLFGARTTLQFTRRLYARLYPQYDTEDEHLDLDALIGYVLHPGSVFYLGINGDLDRLGERRLVTGRTVFLKLSYLFQR